MKVSILRKDSKKDKRINLLYLRFLSHNGEKYISKFKSLKLFEYKSPRNALERNHNKDVLLKSNGAILKAETKLYQEQNSQE